jgi:F-type H+-transporting ATPase subunit gamma
VAQTRDIRIQIQGIHKTRQITDAMRRIASVKTNHARKRAESLRPYTASLLRIVARLIQVDRDYTPSLMMMREQKRIGLIVVTTDRGLCGPLNGRLLALCQARLREWSEQKYTVSITVIGSRGVIALERAGYSLEAEATNIGDVPNLDVESLLGAISMPLTQFLAGQLDAIYVASNHFVNALKHEPTIGRFVPVDPSQAPELPLADTPVAGIDYLYEPEARTVINGVLLRYVETGILRAILENVACEHWARMTAMQAASDNASELINSLTRKYHKIRQEGITRELSEIASGAAALEGH